MLSGRDRFLHRSAIPSSAVFSLLSVEVNSLACEFPFVSAYETDSRLWNLDFAFDFLSSPLMRLLDFAVSPLMRLSPLMRQQLGAPHYVALGYD